MTSDSKEYASRQLGFFFPSFSLNGEIPAAKQDSDTQTQKTLALIPPYLLQEKKEEILKTILDSGFQVAMQHEAVLTKEQAKAFYKQHEGTEYFHASSNRLVFLSCGGPVLALALTRKNAVQHWGNVFSPKILEAAKEKSPNPEWLRLASILENAVHGSSDAKHAIDNIKFIFGDVVQFVSACESLICPFRDPPVMKIVQIKTIFVRYTSFYWSFGAFEGVLFMNSRLLNCITDCCYWHIRGVSNKLHTV
uniref:Nucleoside diphosphate kinase-like domain-containing protein n=1 Tax=Electrophorus electricus TaxID=8005 RepID=A0A4W4HQD4_ELEEL